MREGLMISKRFKPWAISTTSEGSFLSNFFKMLMIRVFKVDPSTCVISHISFRDFSCTSKSKTSNSVDVNCEALYKLNKRLSSSVLAF
jgi:hypothetical protein